MKKILLLFVVLSLASSCKEQVKKTKINNETANAELIQKAKDFQYKLNLQYADKKESPLDSVDFVKFRALDFYPIDGKYIVKASFVKNDYPVPFEMTTTTDRKPIYQKYGMLTFTIDSKEYQLATYQSLDPKDSEEDKQYVSVPFTDSTSGNESYGGGRYVDLKLPLNPEVILDFNQAYNPYCAYSHRWSCVIPPKENNLDVAIRAGVKKYH